MALKRAHRQAENVRGLLLIEKDIHWNSTRDQFTSTRRRVKPCREDLAKFAVYYFGKFGVRVVRWACLPRLSPSFEAGLVEFGPGGDPATAGFWLERLPWLQRPPVAHSHEVGLSPVIPR